MDHLDKNEISSKVSSLEEIIARITKNRANDEGEAREGDIVAVEPVQQKEALKSINNSSKFLIANENSNP